MNDIGAYGHAKYGEESFDHRRKQGDTSRGSLQRCTPEAIAEHAKEHFEMHLRGELHDHFGTRRHQLAAAAFNAMMEFYFAGLENEDVQDDLDAARKILYRLGSHVANGLMTLDEVRAALELEPLKTVTAQDERRSA